MTTGMTCFKDLGMRFPVEKYVFEHNDREKVVYRKFEVTIMNPTSSERAMRRLLQSLDFFAYNGKAVGILRDVDTIRQKGPQCGLVAISMAAASFDERVPCTDELFQMAKIKRYTNCGEIFSIYWLADLAKTFWPSSKVVVHSVPSAEELVQLLLTHHLIIIAFDCDGTLQPCQECGRRAHWAVINGYMQTQSHGGHDEFHVFCVHGMSSRLFLYKYCDIVESNGNLYQAKDNTTRCDCSEPFLSFIVPDDGLKSLRGLCLLYSA